MNNYCEQLIRAKKSSIYSFVNFLMYFFCFFTIIFLTQKNFVLGIILAAITVCIFFFKGRLYVEYEYIFVDGEIEIDLILEAKKRKKAFTFNARDAILIAPIESDSYKNFSDKPSKIIKCYDKETKDKLYAAIINAGANKLQLHFTPNEIFLDCCYKKNPRAVKKY
ncbi:MAG TPA: DUF6106 family protein [Clostridiaceae bacterium]